MAAQAGVTDPDESTPTILYVHMFDAQNDLPMNTQEPEGEFRGRVGIIGTSACIEDPSGTQAVRDKEYHTAFAYGSPQLVEYQVGSEGAPTIHPERGLDHDVIVDAAGATFHWYLATHAGVRGSDAAPIPLANVMVRATMREGDAISVRDVAYREGRIIMSGSSEPAYLAAEATQGAEYISAAGVHIYHFTIDMRIERDVIPRSTGFNMDIEVSVDNPHCSEEGDYLMPSLVDFYNAPEMRPRLELGVMNPVRIGHVGLQAMGNHGFGLYVDASSPWGRYDITSMTAVAHSKDESVVLVPRPQVVETPIADQPHVPPPFVFPPPENLTGTIRYEIHVTTLQGATASAELEYRPSRGDDGKSLSEVVKDASSLGLMALAAVVMSAAMARRRQ